MTSDSREPAAPEWKSSEEPTALPESVRRAFPSLDGPFEIRPLRGGNLHRSYHVRSATGEYVLQCVSDVFAAAIHDNIQSVSRHLSDRGFRTIRLLPTRSGESSVQVGEHGRWRLMPHLGGATFRRLQSAEQAKSAGVLAGRFHAAMRDFDGILAPMGIRYRDTPHYLDALRRALDAHSDHRLVREVSSMAERIFGAFDELGRPEDVPSRVIHGDLKLDNLLFEDAEPPGRDRAFALIDLDTLMRAPLWVELGDAWRSWCNPEGEHTDATRFEMAYFEASVRGFADGYGEVLPEAELASLDTATERICLELCTRYATDALEERYFNWDPSAFPSQGEHNLVRARGQWHFYEAVRDCRSERAAVVRRHAG